MKDRVLVTGATGLIGRHVVRALLASGAEVHACSRAKADDAPAGPIWHGANLLAREEGQSLIADVAPAVVIHCAWVTEHGQFWTAPENAEWAAASVALAERAFERGARRFVGVGTGAEYAPDADMPLSETRSRIAPETLYGAAKDAARRAIEIVAARRNASFAWARVFMLYGAGEHPARLVSSLARAFVKGESAKMSSGKPVRDFMDARDVGAGIAAVARSEALGSVNVASGEPVSVVSVARKLAELSGRPELLAVGALPDRPNEPAASYADTQRLRSEVGFTPSISLERGLADALDYWRKRESAAQ